MTYLPRHMALLLALIACLAWAPSVTRANEDEFPLPTGDESDETPPGVEEEEPELEGDALKAHKKKVKQLFKMLKGEKNKVLVKGHIEGLGAQGDRASRDALMKFVIGNKNQAWVSYAYLALAKIGDKKSVEFLCGKHGLRTKGFLFQQQAAAALAEAKSKHATAPLLEVMTDRRTKTEVVGACAKAVAQSAPNDERVISVLFEQSRHRKDTIRSYTLEAIGDLASDEAIDRLREALFEDKNGRARSAAATGMGWTQRPECIELLRRAIKEDKALQVKDAAQRAILELIGG